jgi:hypothetical protein
MADIQSAVHFRMDDTVKISHFGPKDDCPEFVCVTVTSPDNLTGVKMFFESYFHLVSFSHSLWLRAKNSRGIKLEGQMEEMLNGSPNL